MTPAQAGSDATEQNPAHGRAYGEPWDAVGEDSDREGVIAFVERSSHLGPQEQSIESGKLGDHIFFLSRTVTSTYISHSQCNRLLRRGEA